MTPQDLALNTVTSEPLNAETPHGILKQDRTPNELFFKRNHFSFPEIDGNEWRLDVKLGDSAKSYSLDDLKTFPAKTLLVTMECAGNARKGMDPVPAGTAWGVGAVSQGEFTGTPLSNLIAEADLPEDAIELLFVGADHGLTKEYKEAAYERSLPIAMALHPDILLVWEMNGETLPVEHGYPLRLLVPGWYGMASVKWLTEIRAISEPFTGFFQAKDYVYEGHKGVDEIADGTPVGAKVVRSFILEPQENANVPSGHVDISGIAWSGDTLIAKVELSFDEGQSWVEVELGEQTSRYSMCRWSYHWHPQATGEQTIIARATDAAGNMQPMEAVWNTGGYANNQVQTITVNVN
ncbi:MAG: sulfite oxidase [Chloroflexi bacterium]|nr:MAG: sulfite oxidase [Chloroflexota bacterium]MBL1194129.1 sulfite oxidase [Chloroflexota bacterium]NOH11422.1 sulfite oxidase [Chloroflexota bacterium]